MKLDALSLAVVSVGPAKRVQAKGRTPHVAGFYSAVDIVSELWAFYLVALIVLGLISYVPAFTLY